HLSKNRLSFYKKHKAAEKLDFLHPATESGKTNSGKALAKDNALAYTTAIGLALSQLLSYDST
ncbi:hypothetical protein COV16_01620, partial [Candidatus Woesearchaeota archaeon CG10_big_fil_rev_8_21_14_0_10_34_8]